MTKQEKLTQLRVGIFMAIGLSAVAAMVVYFGRFGDSVRKYYDLEVHYPNASGILKGAGVLLAGAKVGIVQDNPTLLPDMEGVSVKLKIYQEVSIPSASEFTIGSSGLLGDRFVQIVLKKDAKNSPPIAPGATIKGKGETGMSEIFDQVGPMVADSREAIQKIRDVAEKLNTNVMNEKTLKDLQETIANLKTTSASFAASSTKIDAIVDKAQTAIGSGNDAMTSAKSAAEELKKAIADIRAIIQQTKQGRGALGVLLSDKQTADNLKALVMNLRERGILWYKDKPQPAR